MKKKTIFAVAAFALLVLFGGTYLWMPGSVPAGKSPF